MLKFSVKTDGFDELQEAIARACTKAEHICCCTGKKGHKPVCAVPDGLSRPENTCGR